MEDNGNWKTKTLLIGTAIGAVTGFLTAYLLVYRAEKEDREVELTPGEGVRLGLGLLGLIRMLTK